MKRLNIYAQTPPSIGNTATFTVRKNAISTIVTATLTNSSNNAVDSINSVTFDSTDKLSIMVESTSNKVDDVILSVDYY